jgi:hypothetical protein
MLATMGTFIFASLNNPCFGELAGKSPVQTVFLTSFDHPIDCLAVSEAKNNTISPWRHFLSRVILPGLLTAGAGLSCTAIKSITKTAAYNIKNIIPLKLRI